MTLTYGRYDDLIRTHKQFATGHLLLLQIKKYLHIVCKQIWGVEHSKDNILQSETINPARSWSFA